MFTSLLIYFLNNRIGKDYSMAFEEGSLEGKRIEVNLKTEIFIG